MTQFTPGSPDDVAWTHFAAAVFADEDSTPDGCAKAADALMAERAKRLTDHPKPAPDSKTQWRCATCKYFRTPDVESEAFVVWCGKHSFGHNLTHWGCSDWEAKTETPPAQ